MKRPKKLSTSDRRKLYEFYHSSYWDIIRILLHDRREELKELAIQSVDMGQLNKRQGEISQTVWLANELFLNEAKYKKLKEREEKDAKEKKSG